MKVITVAAVALKGRKFVWLLVLTVSIAYSLLAILRHRQFSSGAYDLGIFDQAIWQYSRFHAPFVTVRSNLLTENLLGDHFHPILMLLAPLYWFTDRVEVLLVAQAVLFAIAAVPIFLFTEKRLGPLAGYLIAISYSIFWGIQKAVEFDFHEIAFAVPLIALAIYFIDEKRWTAYFVCLGLLLITKENLSVTVVFFGIYLLAIRQLKQGLISMAAGVIWFFAVFKVFIPFFEPEKITARVNPISSYNRNWSYNQFGSNPFSALKTIVTRPVFLIETLFSPAAKLQTYWYTFHPFLFLAFVSPIFILAIPLIAERFLSQGPQFWGMDYHYSAVITPVVVMASVDGLARITRRVKEGNRRYLIIGLCGPMLAINLFLLPRFPLWQLTSSEYWRLSSNATIGHKAVALIPPDASVAAQAPIVPHLSHRRLIFVLDPITVIPDADYIIAGERLAPAPFRNFQDIAYYLKAQQARGYRKIFEEEGWIVLKREAISGSPVPPFYHAEFVEQTVPDAMVAGQSYPVRVTMRNAGVYTWTAGEGYRLALLSTTNDWGLNRVDVPGTVAAGSTATFNFTVRAPNAPGSYPFRWGMVQDGVTYFGEHAPQIWIKVTTP